MTREVKIKDTPKVEIVKDVKVHGKSKVRGRVNVHGKVRTSVSGNIIRIKNLSGQILAVTVSGNTVQISGQSVVTSISGNVIVTSVSGNIVLISGQDVFLNSGSVTAVINESGQSLNVTTSVSGNIVLISGQDVFTNSGSVTSVSGNVVFVNNLSGQTLSVNISGITVSISGATLVTTVSGNVVNISGQDVILNSGSVTAIINESGQSLNVTTSISGNVINISGQDVILNSGSVTSIINASGQTPLSVTTVSGSPITTTTPTLIRTRTVQAITAASGGQALLSGDVISVALKAVTNNTGELYVGGSGNKPFSGFGYVLSQGEPIGIDVNNFNAIWIVATVSGDKVSYMGNQN